MKCAGRIGILILAAALIVACASKEDKPLKYLSVMTFNVETLFDTQHDLGKLDYTFLPAYQKKNSLRDSVASYCRSLKNPQWRKECYELDWNERKLSDKVLRVVQVIAESTSGCPDILILQEIENEQILRRLKNTLPCNYVGSAISDDRDARGIDVAVLSKYEVRAAKTQTIPFAHVSAETLKDTRGVLDLEVNVSGFLVRVLGVHFPAPFHPGSMRREGVKFLEKLFYENQIATVIGGDFNIPESEERAYKHLAALRKTFEISDEVIRASSTSQGSSYYPKEKTWSFLDKIGMSRNSFDRVECRVVNFLPTQRNEAGQPLSFPLLGKNGPGVSDHFPVLCKASY